MTARASLPIDDVLPTLLAALSERTHVVLEAPPGAGKTTRVPLALLDAPWLSGRRVLMLEPRRLAARAAANYMSRLVGDAVGETVGYRVRGDTRISRRTRVEVVTEGVLTRLLNDDATLGEYGAVLFDEFHERSLHADIGLALTMETQQHVRDDLRIVVMSATLDGDPIARLLGGAASPAPIVRSDGRAYPVETRHRPPRADERVEASVARVIRESLSNTAGDVLVFLPGISEQRRVAERLEGDPLLTEQRVRVHVLHGSLPLAEQEAAIAAAPSGTRKVVLATSIAETSLTIEGVRVVVDSGWSRVARYDARAGLTRLDTIRVSRASADQRRGRAGRVAPGVCYRLWDAAEDFTLIARSRPEMLDADLSALALDLANAGIANPATVRWLDEPPVGAFAAARELLTQLGALEATGRITPHGRAMSALPLAPRLAHLLLFAQQRGRGTLGAEIVALLEERDVLRGSFGPPPADLRMRLEALRRGRGAEEALGQSTNVDRDAMRRVRELVQQLTRDMPRTALGTNAHANAASANTASANAAHDDIDDAGALLALAYPDRVAQRRSGGDGRFLLRSGTGAVVGKGDALRDAEWLAIAELDGTPPDYRVARAAPLTLGEIRDDFAEQIVTATIVEWHESSRSVRARRQTTLGSLTLQEYAVTDIPADQVRATLVSAIASAGVAALPWSDAALRTRRRLAFVHAHQANSEWPDVSDDALTASIAQWLGPQLDGVRKWSELAQLDWNEMLLALLPWSQRAVLERLAPTHIEVPSGSRIAVDYTDPLAPVLAVKLQEVFGWADTPCVCDGQVPLTLHLLSPAQRPVQVTRDLAGFWRSSYFEVRKELRGRYPRHPWPDDPLTAIATRRAKPRGT